MYWLGIACCLCINGFFGYSCCLVHTEPLFSTASCYCCQNLFNCMPIDRWLDEVDHLKDLISCLTSGSHQLIATHILSMLMFACLQMWFHECFSTPLLVACIYSDYFINWMLLLLCFAYSSWSSFSLQCFLLIMHIYPILYAHNGILVYCLTFFAHNFLSWLYHWIKSLLLFTE